MSVTELDTILTRYLLNDLIIISLIFNQENYNLSFQDYVKEITITFMTVSKYKFDNFILFF